MGLRAVGGIAALGIALAAAGQAACRGAAGPPVTTDTLTGSAWHLAELGGQPLPEGVQQTLVWRNPTEVVGTGGCNRFSARVHGKVAVRFGPIAATRQACAPDVMQQEQRYFQLLERGGKLERKLKVLYLVGADGTPQLRWVAARYRSDDDYAR